MNQTPDHTVFIKTINDNYPEIKTELQSFCSSTGQLFDEDIFHDTILKCYERIEKQGYMQATDLQSCKNYLFMAFKRNLKREKQYSRNSKRDENVNVNVCHERYENSKITQQQKLLNDLFIDYTTLYIMKVVEQNFDNEHFYLFRLKTFEKHLTYKRLQQKTGIKAVRQKVVEVKNFLKDNLRKEDVRKAFEEDYSDLFSQ